MAARSSILGNAGDRGAWRATVHRVAKSWTGLSTHTHTHTHTHTENADRNFLSIRMVVETLNPLVCFLLRK